MEGFGLGFSSFLDQIEKKVKLPVTKYAPPKDDYDFNKEEHEVAIGEDELQANDSDQDFDDG